MGEERRKTILQDSQEVEKFLSRWKHEVSVNEGKPFKSKKPTPTAVLAWGFFIAIGLGITFLLIRSSILFWPALIVLLVDYALALAVSVGEKDEDMSVAYLFLSLILFVIILFLVYLK